VGEASIGMLVSIDGPAGVGKSTTAKALADRLRNTGLTVCLTTEPATHRPGSSSSGLHVNRHGLGTASLREEDGHHVEALPARGP
jgi:dTMP kinase